MTPAAARYGRVADGLTARLENVPAGSWTAATPCEDWTAHQLAAHVVDTHRRLLTRLTGGDPTPPDNDEDLAATWSVESGAVRTALADPERAGAMVSSMGGEQPFEELVGTLLCAETVLHTWDLARATGQDEHLDQEAVEAALGFLGQHDAALRSPGGFGPATEPPIGADAQTRLLCFVGRRP